MARNFCLILTLATTGLFLNACAVDDSLPSRPRTASPLEPSQKAQQNAEQRTMEKPSRDMPTAGREFPGQSKASLPTDERVLTLASGGGAGGGSGGAGGSGSSGGSAGSTGSTDAGSSMGSTAAGSTVTPPGNTTGSTSSPISGFSGPSGWHAIGHTTGPTTTYTRDIYSGPLPHLPANPGTVPMPGSTPAPDGDWTIDHSWGQGLTLENAPHRAWPDTTAYYKDVTVKHNPVYYFNIQEHLPVNQNNNTVRGDWVSSAYEVPWFFVNTAILPVLMVLEPPLVLRTTSRSSIDPNFRGHLPAAGDTIPAPYPGSLHWDYPFLNPDGTIKERDARNQINVP